MEKREYKTFIGRLSMNIEALSKTPKGVLATPTYRVDADGNVNNFFQNEGKPMELYSYKDGVEKVYEQMPLKDEGKIRSLALAIDSPTQDNVQWLSLQLWGDIAKEVHINYKKGDLVSLVATKTTNKSQATGKDFNIWNVVNIQKIIFNYQNNKPKEEQSDPATTENDEVAYGFKGIEDTDDVPF